MAVIAIDLDNTLVFGDKPLAYAREAVNILREKNHRVVIHTCNNISWAKKVLDNSDIRYDGIWGLNADGKESFSSGKKPLADLYIDDKGYHFKGDWKTELPEILSRISGFDNRKDAGPQSIARFACGLQLEDEDSE